MKVVCIGSGNVATHFAHALKSSGAELVQIWSKTPEHAQRLATEVDGTAITTLEDISRTADLYLVSVKDDAIAGIVAALQDVQGLVVHTSGATAIDVFPESMQACGVLYPLQTFSRTKTLDFNQVPLCLEARNEKLLEQLKTIAKQLSPLVYEVSSDQRKILHLAAVFACNFVNHLYGMGQQIVEENNLGFEILRPLILETALKVQHALPGDVQTGPAIRKDEQTLIKHKALLAGHPELQDIYETLSNSIKKTD